MSSIGPPRASPASHGLPRIDAAGIAPAEMFDRQSNPARQPRELGLVVERDGQAEHGPVEQVLSVVATPLGAGGPAVIDARVRFDPHPGMPRFGAMGREPH